jgi:hypothetical protein
VHAEKSGDVGSRISEQTTSLPNALMLHADGASQCHKERNPLHHTAKMKEFLSEAINHMRSDNGKVDDPQFKAMFETASKVLAGLVKALSDYERKNEAAWKR